MASLSRSGPWTEIRLVPRVELAAGLFSEARHFARDKIRVRMVKLFFAAILKPAI